MGPCEAEGLRFWDSGGGQAQGPVAGVQEADGAGRLRACERSALCLHTRPDCAEQL